jgi:hypothetical protein
VPEAQADDRVDPFHVIGELDVGCGDLGSAEQVRFRDPEDAIIQDEADIAITRAGIIPPMATLNASPRWR